MENNNKPYHVTFTGEYMGGHMIVVAETKRKAFNRAKKKIEALGLLDDRNEDFSMDDVHLIDLESEHVNVLFSGDY